MDYYGEWVHFFVRFGGRMNSKYYYSFTDSLPARALNACSLESTEYPLAVNCAGNLISEIPFVTDNPQGRADYYLIYVVSGTMNISIDDVCCGVSAGDVIVFPPHCHYRYEYFGGERLSYLWVHFTGSYAERFTKRCLSDKLPNVFDAGKDSKISGDFRRMFEIFEAGSSFRTEELAVALEALILDIAFSIRKESDSQSFERSLHYIHSHYNKDVRIDELASMENISYYRYIKLFCMKMGIPPAAYLINLRINAACDMLLNTDMSIKQIGISVGYGDPHFFSRLFKKHTGMSPREYRESILRNKGE